MAKYRVVYEREGCIGATAYSAIDTENWTLDDENKAVLKNSKGTSPGIFEREITEEELELQLNVAHAYSVNHIYNKETGETLI